MLTTDDKKEIRKIVREEVDIRTDPISRSLVEIERDRKILKDIWEFVKSHTINFRGLRALGIRLSGSKVCFPFNSSEA